MLDLALDGKVFITNEIDAAMQELDILFNTERTELINNPYYGTNFEQFLWVLSPNVYQVKEYILKQIGYTYFLRNLEYEIDVQVLKGEYRAIYDVKIAVKDNDGNVDMREYEFR